jgi:hypothetical protein
MTEPNEKSEIEQLCAKLAALELSEDQRALLDGILAIAWDYVGSHGTLEAEFNGCFEPDEAALILAYQSAPQSNSITRSLGGSSITRSVGGSITKSILP